MRLQFASDLHLNSWAAKGMKPIPFEEILTPVAKTLILCGDVGHPDSEILKNFFDWAATRWETIFWIPGHHEFTDVWHLKKRSYDECLANMRIVVLQYPNIQILHRDKFMTEDGFMLLACPLWARLTAMSEEMSKDIVCQDITKHYQEDLEWLKQEIKKTNHPIVVATHYPPTYSLMDKDFINKPLSVPYALETEILLRPPVVAWVCGYVHKAAQLQRPWSDARGGNGQILMVVNPRGYPDDWQTGYRTEAVLRLLKNS